MYRVRYFKINVLHWYIYTQTILRHIELLLTDVSRKLQPLKLDEKTWVTLGNDFNQTAAEEERLTRPNSIALAQTLRELEVHNDGDGSYPPAWKLFIPPTVGVSGGLLASDNGLRTPWGMSGSSPSLPAPSHLPVLAVAARNGLGLLHDAQDAGKGLKFPSSSARLTTSNRAACEESCGAGVQLWSLATAGGLTCNTHTYTHNINTHQLQCSRETLFLLKSLLKK